MQLKMFTIRDSKTEFYGNPFYQHTHGEAERTFTELVMDPKSKISQYPEDYDLYFLGEYDNLTGKFAALDTPTHVVKATGVMAKS